MWNKTLAKLVYSSKKSVFGISASLLELVKAELAVHINVKRLESLRLPVRVCLKTVQKAYSRLVALFW